MASNRNLHQEINNAWSRAFASANALASTHPDLKAIHQQALSIASACDPKLANLTVIHQLLMDNYEAIKSRFSEEKSLESDLFVITVTLNETKALALQLAGRISLHVNVGEKAIEDFKALRTQALQYTPREFSKLSRDTKNNLADVATMQTLKDAIDKLNSTLEGLIPRQEEQLPQAKKALDNLEKAYTKVKATPFLFENTIDQIYDFAVANQKAYGDYQKLVQTLIAKMQKYQEAHPKRDSARDVSINTVLAKVNSLVEHAHIQPNECFSDLYHTIKTEQALTQQQHYAGFFGKMKRNDSELVKTYQAVLDSISGNQRDIINNNINNNNNNNNTLNM